MTFNEEQQNQCYYILRECAKHHIQIRLYVITQFIYIYIKKKELCLSYIPIYSYIKYIHTQFSSLIIVDYMHGLTSVSFALFQLSVRHN